MLSLGERAAPAPARAPEAARPVTLLRLHGVRGFAGGREAVAGVDLDVSTGEIVTLTGPSGSGKTTLLRLVAGLDAPSAGQIAIGDRIVNELGPKARDVAMVFQGGVLYPQMTVRKNLAFGLSMHGRPKAEIAERVAGVAARLGIEALLEKLPADLSRVEQQKVALGRALVRRPALFLLDEPFAGMDAATKEALRRDVLAMLREMQATVLWSTNDQAEALAAGQRVVVIEGGTVQQVGTPQDVWQKPANVFVAGFIGAPAMNLLPGTLVRERGPAFKADGGLAIPMLDLPFPQADEPVTFGVRPDDVRLERGSARAASSLWTLQQVEQLGGDMLVHATKGALRLVARARVQTLPPPGTEIVLYIDPQRAVLFDQSGRARA